MCADMKFPQATNSPDIAIIGMAGRFPGAPTLRDFWRNLVAGVESVSFFSRDELLEAGVSEDILASHHYVGAKAILDDAERFDARYFDLSKREATVMDPQFRVFLETVAGAMEDAGYAADNANRRTGIFAGAGSNTYQEYLRAHPELIEQIGQFQATILNEKDFLPTWAAYKLNLTGPCVTVQSACATSLATVHLACQSLLNGECDIALAGGVSLLFPQRSGYQYFEGGLLSPDGHCRAFDATATGCVPGEGVGVVVLRRLDDAIEQGDVVRAIIKASSINNDGSDKISFLAPSETGIATAVAESITISGIDCETIRYVEAHGTGTTLGDPIEIAALTKAFRAQTEKKQFCAIGSVKTNIGHLNTAAGIASLIKTVLALENGIIPPSLHCEEPNPLMKFSQTPFYISTQAEEWTRNGTPRRAAVNAFGIGGTNAHVILEEAPLKESPGSSQDDELILLSARSETALRKAAENLAAHLENSPSTQLSAVAYTLGVGRRAHEYRRIVVCTNVADAVKALKENLPDKLVSTSPVVEDSEVTFVFRDRGAEYTGLASDLYRSEPVFRQEIQQCAAISQTLLAVDILSLIDRSRGSNSSFDEHLTPGPVSAAVSVAVEYALAKLLISWGINPQAVVGEGTGEYAAGCIAGILSLNDALSLAVIDGPTANDSIHISLIKGLSLQTYERESDRSPRLPFYSTALGKWIGSEDTIELEGWLQSPRSPASSAQFLESLADSQNRLLLEIGIPSPSSAREQNGASRRAIATLRHQSESVTDREKLLTAVGRLWLAGIPVDWQSLYSNQKRYKLSLPTYPFERQRYWAGAVDENDDNPENHQRSHDRTDAESCSTLSERTYVEPENDLQAVVAAVWAASLSVEQLGIHDDFFEIGGNSLVATRIILAIRETLQVELPLRSIFDSPTVASLSEEIEKAAKELDTDIHDIARVVREISVLPMDQVKKRLAVG